MCHSGVLVAVEHGQDVRHVAFSPLSFLCICCVLVPAPIPLCLSVCVCVCLLISAFLGVVKGPVCVFPLP